MKHLERAEVCVLLLFRKVSLFYTVDVAASVFSAVSSPQKAAVVSQIHTVASKSLDTPGQSFCYRE